MNPIMQSDIHRFSLPGYYSMFKDRKDAGQKLAIALTMYMGEEPLVLAIPRGGVVVGY
jgi:predicted phosphoribosyltransferase